MNLKDSRLYYIGGVVRDELLGHKSFDIDLVYDGNAIEFAKTISQAEILKVNESFGTVKIKFAGEEIDIASTRNEIYPQKGHLPVVDKIGCSLKEDVLRRDFTINSIAKSTSSGEIIDYTGGLSDLKNKKLRILHSNSFIDDPTRIIRALKFSVRFNFELENNTKKLRDEYLSKINYDMSYKRLQKELKETFNLNIWNAYKHFINDKIYKLISPEEFKLPDYNFSNLIKTYKPDNIWIIYIGLLPNIKNLPLTKQENKIVQEFKNLKENLKLKKNPPDDYTIYKYFKCVPLESVIMYSTISPGIVEKYLSSLKFIELQISGKDFINMGIKPSHKFQECFDYLLGEKISNPNLKLSDEIGLAKGFFNIQDKI